MITELIQCIQKDDRWLLTIFCNLQCMFIYLFFTANRIGRYLTFCICCVVTSCLALLVALSPNPVVFGILRFLVAASNYGLVLVVFVMGTYEDTSWIITISCVVGNVLTLCVIERVVYTSRSLSVSGGRGVILACHWR